MTSIRGGGGRPPEINIQQPTAAEAADAVSRQVGQVASVRPKRAGAAGTGSEQAEQPAVSPGASKLTTADAERIVSQSGLMGMRRKRKDLVDGDDGGSGQPLLPYDDVEAIENEVAEGGGGQLPRPPLALHQGLLRQWLVGLQQSSNLTDLTDMMGQLMGEIAKGGGGLDGADLILLQQLADAPPQPVPDTAMAQQSLVELFAIDTSMLPVGQQLAAASLAVSGNSDSLQPGEQGIEEQAFAQGVAKVVEEGQQALDSGDSMQDGVHKELALHRTFVVRR